jgi:putative ABC transport system ATP-binding protein
VTRDDAIVSAEELHASYGQGRLTVPVLRGLSLEVERGAAVAVMGPSGSGKTTLLALLGGLDKPHSGRLVVDGIELVGRSRRELGRFRRLHVGFVFQAFHLLPGLTAEENVAAGLDPLGLPRAEIRRRSHASLDAVGLLALARRFPRELSGGEQQRVAVARACAKEPPLLLADEPTGNLDEDSARNVLTLLFDAPPVKGRERTLIVVTHDASVGARADRVMRLKHGQLELAVATPGCAPGDVSR